MLDLEDVRKLTLGMHLCSLLQRRTVNDDLTDVDKPDLSGLIAAT